MQRIALAQAVEQGIDFLGMAPRLAGQCVARAGCAQRRRERGWHQRIRRGRRPGVRTWQQDFFQPRRRGGRAPEALRRAATQVFHRCDEAALRVVQGKGKQQGVARSAQRHQARIGRRACIAAYRQAADLGRQVDRSRCVRLRPALAMHRKLQGAVQQHGRQQPGRVLGRQARRVGVAGHDRPVGLAPACCQRLECGTVLQPCYAQRHVVPGRLEVRCAGGRRPGRRRASRGRAAGQQPRAQLRLPRHVAQVACRQAEPPVRGVHGHPDFLARPSGQREGRQDIQFLHVQPVAGRVLPRRGQRDFSEPGRREQDGAAHHVVGEPRLCRRVQFRLPGSRCLAGIAQQWMGGAARQQARRARRHGVPVRFALPGVGGQVGVAPASREHLAPANGGASQYRLRGRRHDSGRRVVAARAGGDHHAWPLGLLERVVGVAAQHGVRTHLDQDVQALRCQVLQRRLERDGLADVAPPIVRVQLPAVQWPACDGGVEGGMAGAWRQVRQGVDQFGLDAIHGRGVEGVVQVQPAARDALLRQPRLESRQRGDRAAHGHAVGAVAGGDMQLRGQPRLRQGLGGLPAAQRHGRHAALAARRGLQAAAMMDDAHRVRQAQRAAGPSGRHLAHAVAHDRERADVALRQHFRDAHLHGEERGLRDCRVVVAAGLGRPRQFVFQGVAGQGPEHGVDGAYGVAEYGVVQQLRAHARPLRPVAGIEEHRPLRLGHALPGVHRQGGLASLREGPQAVGHGPGLPAPDDGAMGVPVALEDALVGLVVQRGAAPVLKRPRHRLGGCVQRLRRPAADHHRQHRVGGARRGPALAQGVGALQDEVGVGAAEAEGVHADRQASLRAQRQGIAHQRQVPGIEVDGGVGGVDADGGGHLAVDQAMQGLDHSRRARRGFQVAHVALDRADRQGGARGTRAAQRRADGLRLDGVAHRGARAVGLQVVQFRGVDACLGIGPAQQRGLRLAAGHGKACLAAIGVDGGVGHHRQDAVAVRHCLVMALEQEQPRAFGAHVAVGRGVEGTAAAARREHAGLGEHHEAVRMRVQADAAGQRLCDFAGTDRLASLVQRHQRGRAGGVQRHAGAAQVERVGNAVGDDAGGIARGRGRIDGVQVFGHPVGVIDAGDADIHATIAAPQGAGPHTGVLQRFPGQLQQHALLRVHLRRLARRDAEEVGIEAGDVAHRAGRERVGRAGMRARRMKVSLLAPARLVGGRDEVAPLQQVFPVVIPVGAGETKGVADDRDAMIHA
ncbi:hypothetical protein AMP9_3695 [plant metagenome]|uniref:Uncharacterized protein n=1 Tax=plant metagenome TaxID=1297885 RepID=A0A484Q0D1_9ZZZZ